MVFLGFSTFAAWTQRPPVGLQFAIMGLGFRGLGV